MSAKPILSQNKLKELFIYNGKNLIWRSNGTGRRKAGSVAGTIHKLGYRIVSINGYDYKEHSLVWLYHYGCSPKQIDHINHIRDDNSISNLRLSNHSLNNRNRSYVGNNTGFTGVYARNRRKKYAVKIGVNGKLIEIGNYDTLQEAISARLFANSYYNFHENHGL